VKISYLFSTRRVLGFTLIELMVTVAIIGVLSAIAIPSYIAYMRRSYLSEATSSISSIKSAEESFFTINNCYVDAGAHPGSVPSGTSSSWDNTSFPSPNAWARNALGVRPDKNVRFQYQVYASNQLSAAGGCGTANATTSIPNPLGCVTTPATTLVSSTIFGSNWYIVVARGDLNGDGVASNIISAIDDSTVIKCSELE
jgi:prepilin-type N-terminal cleavage/methylation domain-containing protein